jgi:hypothetical protein
VRPACSFRHARSIRTRLSHVRYCHTRVHTHEQKWRAGNFVNRRQLCESNGRCVVREMWKTILRGKSDCVVYLHGK